MSVSIFSLGITPASESLSAFTITMNRIVLFVLPNFCCFHLLVERAGAGSTVYFTLFRRGRCPRRRAIPMRSSGLTRGLLTRQPFDFQERPNLDRAVPRGRNSLGDRQRFIQVFRLNDVVTPELLACFGKRPIRHDAFAVAHTHTRRGRD